MRAAELLNIKRSTLGDHIVRCAVRPAAASRWRTPSAPPPDADAAVAVGIDHRTAPLTLREALDFRRDGLDAAHRARAAAGA
jgi:hypothetical protein